MQENNVAELLQMHGERRQARNAVSGFQKSRINLLLELQSDDEEFIGADASDISLEAQVSIDELRWAYQRKSTVIQNRPR